MLTRPLLLASSTEDVRPQFKFWNKKGSSKKIPISAASMSRQTMGGYLRLYLKNRRKIHEGKG